MALEQTLDLAKLGAGIAIGFGAIGGGLGLGIATKGVVDAIARQPEAKKDIRSSLLLGCALAEATAIYGLIVAILIIFFLK